jgi:DNA mismatch repair protein MutS
LAIASGILKYLSRNIKPWTLFATHYHELVPLSSDFDNVSCFQTEVVQDETSIRFTHRLVEGASGSSFGIEVARLAGIPQGVLQEAKQFLALLERQGDISLNEKATIQQPKPSNQGHPIDRQNEVIARIERTNPNRLTPLQALNLLVELKDILEKDPPVDIFSNFLSFKPSISTGEDEAGLKGS